jgi:hypothetical protein
MGGGEAVGGTGYVTGFSASAAGPQGIVDLVTAAATTGGTSFVTSAVSVKMDPSDPLAEFTSANVTVECAFIGSPGSGVISSSPILRLTSAPRDMAQMVIFASIPSGETATLKCAAEVYNAGGPIDVSYRWDGAIGLEAVQNKAGRDNQFPS